MKTTARILALGGLVAALAFTGVVTARAQDKSLLNVSYDPTRELYVQFNEAFAKHWKAGQLCLIPATAFYEPNWETGANVWWRFARADGHPWSVAGLWSEWTDPATGEVVPSYTMVTVNADAHPLMKHMHKPDPRLGPDKQDKRSLVLLEQGEVDRWLRGTTEEARALIKLTPVEEFDAAPADSAAPELF